MGDSSLDDWFAREILVHEGALVSFLMRAWPHRAEVHDWVTRVPGSFERTVAGVRALRAEGVAVVLKTPVMRFNERELDEWVALARSLGAQLVLDPEPAAQLIETLADWSGATLRRPWNGLPAAYPGHVDVIYDTVGNPRTVEVGIRLLREQGTLVQLGVSSPGRFEWTP